jgi:glycosyltransferase involved in cell wall biosynthesis
MALKVAVFRPPHARHDTMFELQAAMYRRLVEEGHAEVTVFHDAARPFKYPGLETRAVRSGFGPFAHRLEKSFGIRPYRSALRALSGFDVIETSDPTLYAYPQVALKATRRCGTALVCGSSVTLWSVRTAAASRAREVLESATAILCTTPLARRRFEILRLIRAGDPRVVITGHPVDLDRFRPARSDRKERVVLTVCRLEESKGLIEALEAFQAAPEEWSWWVVGEGPLRQRLQDLVADLNLEGRVRLVGAMPHKQIHNLYARASILLHLPRSTAEWEEYFGAVLIEAMASGVAVVANRTGAIPWVVGDAGVLVDSPDAGDALRRLIDDESLRVSLAMSGRRLVEDRFAIGDVAGRVLSAWHKGGTDLRGQSTPSSPVLTPERTASPIAARDRRDPSDAGQDA